MLPQNHKLLREQMSVIMRKYPYVSDKELYYRVLNDYYVRIGEEAIKKLAADQVPSMDTLLRRKREIVEELKRERVYKPLFDNPLDKSN